MNDFVQKKISLEMAMNEKLKLSRLEKGLSLEEIEEKIKIKREFLEALENGRYQDLPGQVYGEKFLKVYGEFLGLDAQELIESYQKDYKVFNYLEGNGSDNGPRFFQGKIFRFRLIGIVVLLVFFYLAIIIFKSINPPSLTISYPVDNLITKDREIEILGQTNKDSQVKINGQIAFCDNEGKFKESFFLQAGVNVIKITAAKKHSKETVVLKRVMLIENTDSFSFSN